MKRQRVGSERETGRRGPWERGWKRGISKKWNNKTNSDLQGCKRKPQQPEASNEPPCNLNGRKKGYMKIMKELWDETGYALLNLTEQNLRDQATRLEKVGGSLTRQDQTPSALNHGLPITSWNSQKSVVIPEKMLVDPVNFFFGGGGRGGGREGGGFC